MFDHINKLIILSIVLSLFFIPTINSNAMCVYNRTGETPGDGVRVGFRFFCGFLCRASRDNIKEGDRACIVNKSGIINAFRDNSGNPGEITECSENVEKHGWINLRVQEDERFADGLLECQERKP